MSEKEVIIITELDGSLITIEKVNMMAELEKRIDTHNLSPDGLHLVPKDGFLQVHLLADLEELATLRSELASLKAEVERVRGERDGLKNRILELFDWMGTPSDVRKVENPWGFVYARLKGMLP